ncbi:MAG: hypothetical protein ACK2UO_14295, partial [Caldilineaceae bacterium]
NDVSLPVQPARPRADPGACRPGKWRAYWTEVLAHLSVQPARPRADWARANPARGVPTGRM